MKSVKISVIVPTLDNVDTIHACLDSIRGQEEKSLEILCLDAGSRDGTVAALEKQEKEDFRVRFLKGRRKNCGSLLNRGIRDARGEYIAFAVPGSTILEGMYKELGKIADVEHLDFIQSNIMAADGRTLNGHASYFGRVFCPQDGYAPEPEEGQAVVIDLEAEAHGTGMPSESLGSIPWLELGRYVTNGLYRRSFLVEKKIRFNELPGMDIPVTGFWFQVFMHAGRAYLVEREYCREAEAAGQNPESVFKEYDFIGAILHRNRNFMKMFRKVYGKAYVQDVLAASAKVSSVSFRAYMEKAASCFRELHEDGMLDYYALEPEEHKAVTDIMYDTEGYCENRLLGDTPRMGMEFLFPYHMFPEGSRIVIYGAGNVGRTIYRQAMHDGYVRIEGIVDRGADGMEAIDMPVRPLKAILGMEYDYVLIAIRSRDVANDVKKDLIGMGIPEEKVKWDGTAYFRDEFYRRLYFPMLRAWNENYVPHKEFVHAFETKMQGSINDHVFPYHLFQEGASVALYGAGDIGKKYYRQATHDGYVRIVGIVDRNPAGIYAPDVPVKPMQEIKNMECDYVLITVHGGSAIRAIKEDLGKLGIPEKKIRWDGETYYRDEFYRNVYFPLLREFGGDFRDRKQMLGKLKNRLRMAIYDHIFPYHLFHEGETIAIYGAGDVGRKFYQQAKDYGWVKVVVIVDKNAEKINVPGIPVAPIGALKQFNFDKVLISMTNETWANEARETLIRMGIADERIKWAGNIYWRENFYRRYWFEYLRFVHEMRRSKI